MANALNSTWEGKVSASSAAAKKKGSVDAAEVAVLSELRDDNKKESLWGVFQGGQYASAFLPISFGKSLV